MCRFTEIQHFYTLSHHQITDELESLMLPYVELIRKGTEAGLGCILFYININIEYLILNAGLLLFFKLWP